MHETPEKAPTVRLVTIDAGQEGQRIDNFLTRIMKGVPKGHLYRILRTGQVRVNKGRIRADYRLKIGDVVRIPPVRQAHPSPAARIPESVRRRLVQAVLYEDDDLLILNKPSGIAVHGGSGLDFGIIEALRELRPELRFLELVHRLDRETSGCLVLAKNRPVLLGLQEQLRTGTMDKRYLALAAGRWKGGDRTVSAPLRKNVPRGGERVVEVCEAGKPALTHFHPVAVYRDATLLEVNLETGRTHQIRVHAAHIGNPLAGDEKYGSAGFNRTMKQAGLKRLFLHAHSLSFRRPGSDQGLHFSAPLDTELQQVLDRLETCNPITSY